VARSTRWKVATVEVIESAETGRPSPFVLRCNRGEQRRRHGQDAGQRRRVEPPHQQQSQARGQQERADQGGTHP
jgi:hypothetical protein